MSDKQLPNIFVLSTHIFDFILHNSFTIFHRFVICECIRRKKCSILFSLFELHCKAAHLILAHFHLVNATMSFSNFFFTIFNLWFHFISLFSFAFYENQETFEQIIMNCMMCLASLNSHDLDLPCRLHSFAFALLIHLTVHD